MFPNGKLKGLLHEEFLRIVLRTVVAGLGTKNAKYTDYTNSTFTHKDVRILD